MKSIISLTSVAAGCMLTAMAATEVSYSGATLADKLTDSFSSEVLTSVTTPGNSDYTLKLGATNGAVAFTLDTALYFASINSDGGDIKSYSIDFGTNGSLTASTKFDQWGGAIRFDQKASVTLNATVDSTLLGEAGSVYTRWLMGSTDETNNGLWNAGIGTLTLNVSGLDADTYTYVGRVTDLSKLEAGQYGYYAPGGIADDGADSISLVVGVAEKSTVPEPATATLSLLALAGLAARRRRR